MKKTILFLTAIIAVITVFVTGEANAAPLINTGLNTIELGGISLATVGVVLPAMQSDNFRRVLDNVKQEFSDYSILPNYMLRTQKALDDSKSDYTFNIRKQGTQETFESEKYLDVEDLFICTHIGFHVSLYSSTNPGLQQFHTYESLQFDSITPTSFNEAHLRAAWNGKLNIEVNKMAKLEDHQLIQHYGVPSKQYGEVVTAVGTKVASPQIIEENVVALDNYSQDAGFIEQTPQFELSGGDDIKIRLNMATVGTPKWAHDGTAASNLLTVSFYGILVYKGAETRK